MKTKKKPVFSLCFLLMVCLCIGMKTEAASQSKKAKEAYARLLSKRTITFRDNDNHKMKIKPKSFSVINLDNDKIPELAVGDGKVYNYLFQYRSGRVEYIGFLPGFCTIYNRTHVIHFSAIAGVGATYEKYLRYSGKKTRKQIVLASYSRGMNFVEYRGAKNKIIGASKYRALVKKYTGSSKGVEFPALKNTQKNRNRYLR